MPNTKTARRRFPKGTPLLTDQQAAERAACSVSTIRRLRRAGALPTTTIGAAVRIPQAALDDYLAGCTTGGGQ
jgi:excisionase family DNA binding protein